MRRSATSSRRKALGGAALAVVWLAAWPAQAEPSAERFDTVVIDAGHGGEDQGARGPGGALEKDVVLAVARDLAKALEARSLKVVMTRRDDSFVSLEERTSIANDARGDLFVSIHANAAADARIRGSETFFLSLDATDAAAQRVADRENLSFRGARAAPAQEDPLVAILGQLMESEHLQESQEFARLAQAGMARLEPEASRGVKQAPFVVLSGVQMPASLVEIGFITNPGEERSMRGRSGRRSVVEALARAILDFGRRFDARRGLAAAPAQRLE